MTKTATKPISVIETQEPLPPLLSAEDVAHLRRRCGVNLLQLQVPMLPSINDKNQRGKGNRLFTTKAYREQETAYRWHVCAQVQSAGWTVSKEDRYVLILHFPFTVSPQEKDVDGPLKPSIDCLEQWRPTKAERATFLTMSIQELWYRERPPAISNDKYVMDIHLMKHVAQPEGTPALIKIYQFPSGQQYHPYPIDEQYHTWLLQH